MSQLESLLEQMQRQIDLLEGKIESLEAAEYNRLTSLYIIDGSDAPSAATGWAIMYIDATDGDLKIIFEDSTIFSISAIESVTGGDSHDHDGGDGAAIPEAGLASAVSAQLVTNGDSHDHVGGDGNPIAGIVTGGNSHNHDGGDGAEIPEGGLASAVSAQLVTGGDNHNHDGGDGAEIDTGALASKAVTQAKIDDLAVDTGQIAASAVETAKINNDAVDDTKVGNRVPQFYRRKGGSSSNWSTLGTTTYTPGAVRMQGGVSGVSSSGTSVSFPTSFGDAPIVVGITYNGGVSVRIGSVSSSSVTFNCFSHSGAAVEATVSWIAVGPE